MEYRLALIFLSVYYLRPQDWVPGLVGANLIKPIIAIWLLVLMANRSRPSPLPGLLRTPHDWVMLLYYGYVVWNAPDASTALTDFLSLAVFYALTVQSLTSWAQMEGYLKWWNAMLLAVAAFAVLSLTGFDPTGARELTAKNVDRLCLGTWLHNNPNALGHSVIAAIPLSYLLYFWKGTVGGRFIAFPVCFFLAGLCAWETESKGAFLVGGALIVLVFVIGRHWIVKISAVALAFTVGLSALSFLPRMSEMGNLRSDEGVIGRIMAWEQARTVTRQQPTGVGFRQFQALIDWRDGARFYKDIPKATHASYVQIGGDLGKYGLFLYLAGLWVALHTVLALKTTDDRQERCRRAVMVLLVANLMSGWMINRQYHSEYFLLIAAAAAMHRIRKGEELAARQAATAPEDNAAERLSPDAETSAVSGPESAEAPVAPVAATVLAAGRKPLWNRLGLIDLGATFAMTWATFWLWDYVLNML